MSRAVPGWQILLLVWTVSLLSVPAGRWFVDAFAIHGWSKEITDRAFAFLVAALLFLAVPPLRRQAADMLGTSIPSERIREVMLVVILKPFTAMAGVGALALMAFASGGTAGPGRMMFGTPLPETQMAAAFSPYHMALFIVVGGMFAPVLEEIVFRGMLQRAWERRWGWFAATLMSAGAFGLFHGNWAGAFVAGIIFSCVYRRAGSLLAPIACHMVSNVLLWFPLLGQFVYPSVDDALGDPSTWGLQLSCLLVAAIAIPAYLLVAARFPHEEQASTEVLGQPA